MIIINTEKRLVAAQMEIYDVLDSIDPVSIKKANKHNNFMNQTMEDIDPNEFQKPQNIVKKTVQQPAELVQNTTVQQPIETQPTTILPNEQQQQAIPPVQPSPIPTNQNQPPVASANEIPPGPVNDIFKEILQRMGVNINEKRVRGPDRKTPPLKNTNQAIPEDLLEKILEQPMGNSTVENVLAKTVPASYEEYKGQPMTRDFLKGFVGLKIKNFITRERMRGWDFEKFLGSMPSKFVNKDQVKAPGWLKELVSRIDEVNKKGMPPHVKDMYPMPDAEYLTKHPSMARKIEAERVVEAFRFYNWEDGKVKTDANGRVLRAGEPGTRTHNAISELNRTFKALDSIATPSWTPLPKNEKTTSHELKPFGGLSSYGNPESPFNHVKQTMEKAISQNEADGGQTEKYINAKLMEQGLPPITLDKKRWSKGGDLYVNNEMLNPAKIGRDPRHVLRAMEERKGNTKSYDLENDAGDRLFDTDKNERPIFNDKEEEEDVGNIGRILDPLDLLSKGHGKSDGLTRKQFTVPAVSKEIAKQLSKPIPTDEKGMRDYVKNYFAEKIKDAEAKLALIPDDRKPENDAKAEVIIQRMQKYKEDAYRASKLPADKLSDFAKDVSGGSVDLKSIEEIVHDLHNVGGLNVSNIANQNKDVREQAFFKTLNKLRENGYSRFDDHTIRSVFDAMGKTYRNWMKFTPVDPMGKNLEGMDFKNSPMYPIIPSIIEDMQRGYSDKLASLSSIANKNTLQKTEEMESIVKSKVLNFLSQKMSTPSGSDNNVSLKDLLADPMIANMLRSNFTKRELETGKPMISRNSDIDLQRLNRLIIDTTHEVLNKAYDAGKASNILEAKTLRRIRVAMFLNKNLSYGLR